MIGDRGPFSPVFLEPRDDYWEVHVPERVGVDDQREWKLVPLETAVQLKTAILCEDCFPERG